jgi:hypothetical protein
MPLPTTLTTGTTLIAGPFAPNYAAGCYGFIAAPSNPSGDSAGALSAANYYGAPIVAIANDSQATPTQLIVALEGDYDQTFLGTFTDTHGNVWLPTAAAFIVDTVNELQITSWTWQLGGLPGLANGALSFADTPDILIDLTAVTTASTEIDLAWTNTGPGSGIANYLLYRGVAGAAPTLYQTLPNNQVLYSDTGLAANTEYCYYVTAVYTNGQIATSSQIQVTTPAPGVAAAFNCNCEAQPLPADGFMVDTLGNLRNRVAIRCGYGQVANNLPSGISQELNERLRDAQMQLYRQHSEYRTKRLYAWQMVVNQRYYGFSADESGCRTLDPYSIDWVGFEDLNQAWYPLVCGIDPVLYTRAQISTGWPTHYEIRSCIEIFPAPRAAYTLWIKARFGLDPFVADTDCTTIDAEAVYLLAAGTYMTSKGHPEGASVMSQAANYTKYLVAGQHNTRRYVPRTRVQTPMTPPRFLPLES